MKIKISKSQWENMGKKAGWMDTYKSIRKQNPKPGYVINDDENPKHHRIKNIGGEEGIPNIEDLKHEAEIACELKGHSLSKWHGDNSQATNICQKCQAEVQVLTNPMPNEIDVGGEAVAINCTGTK